MKYIVVSVIAVIVSAAIFLWIKFFMSMLHPGGYDVSRNGTVGK